MRTGQGAACESVHGVRHPACPESRVSALFGPHEPGLYVSTAGGDSRRGWTMRHVSSTLSFPGKEAGVAVQGVAKQPLVGFRRVTEFLGKYQ